jgi:iron complex transport system ATP-binding protein
MELESLGMAVREISFKFAEREILRGISFDVQAGEVLGILGPNGAGKSTLLRLLAGLLEPEAGTISLGGQDLPSLRPLERARTLAFVLPVQRVPFAFSAREIVLMGRHPRLSHRWLDASVDLAVVEKAMERLDVADLGDRPFSQLSQGEQQRVLLARALAQETPIVLMDEPTSHLDPAHALAVARLCRDLAQEGRTVVAVFHDLNLAAKASDSLLFLKDGTVAALGPSDEVLTAQTLREVFGIHARRVEGQTPQVLLEES